MKSSSKTFFKDDFEKFVIIEWIIHQFFHRNELPTMKKVLEIVNADPILFLEKFIS